MTLLSISALCYRNVVQAFYTSGILIDVLTNFNQDNLSEEFQRIRKYAKWKAAYIHNCLKNGEIPQPGPAAGGEDDEGMGNEGEDFGPGPGPSPPPPNPQQFYQPQPPNPTPPYPNNPAGQYSYTPPAPVQQAYQPAEPIDTPTSAGTNAKAKSHYL